jgi:hypothetical protein
MKRVSFGTAPVQKGKRVKLNDNLLENLQIIEGDVVEVLLDTNKQEIILKKTSVSEKK